MLILLAAAAPVYASGDSSSEKTGWHHVQDPGGLLSESGSREIENAAAQVLSRNGVALFVYVDAGKIAEPDKTGGAIYQNYAATDAAVVMMTDAKGSSIRAYGRAGQIFTGSELKKIRKEAEKQSGREKVLLRFVELTGSALTEKGVLPIPEGRLLPRLVDDADLLTSGDEYTIVSKLDSISEKWQLDVVIVTNQSLGGKTVDQYADDFFDYNGYGYGENDDGILLLVSMDTREWAISTYGRAIQIFTDRTQEVISETFLSYLSEGDYYGGFLRFADMCDSTMENYQNGESQYESTGRAPFGWVSAFFWSAIAGLAVGVIVALSLRSQLTSVKPQAMASAYSKPGSLKLTERSESFLYHNITRVPIPRDSGSGSSGGSRSGGHSSTHSSSSGRSHGGSHGHF